MQNLVPNEPTLRDLLDQHTREIFLGLNCHQIGIVQSFDATKQIAQVSIAYKKTIFVFTEKLGYQSKLVDYPVIIDAPVIFLGGGSNALTFPVAKGDECLILFNDRNIDNWFQGNTGAALPNFRLHSFADAIILVGIRSTPNVVPNFNTTAAEFRTKDGNTSVSVDGDKVQLKKGSVTLDVSSDKITGNVGSNVSIEIDSSGKFKVENASGEYTAAILQLLTDIQNATVTTMLGPQMLIMPTFVADKAILETFES